jgi:hypothetical protein
VAGRPELEAVVPIGSIADKNFVLIYDNAVGFSTGVALANPDPDDPTTVTLRFRDEGGSTYATETITLGPWQHIAFSMPDRYPVTKNRRGTVFVSGSGDMLSGLGLRFNPSGAFTSFHILNTESMF